MGSIEKYRQWKKFYWLDTMSLVSLTPVVVGSSVAFDVVVVVAAVVVVDAAVHGKVVC